MGGWEGDVVGGAKGKAVEAGFSVGEIGLFWAGERPDRTAHTMLKPPKRPFLPFPIIIASRRAKPLKKRLVALAI